MGGVGVGVGVGVRDINKCGIFLLKSLIVKIHNHICHVPWLLCIQSV